MATTLKNARMELKTTEEAKELLSLAAALDGMDLTAFVLGPAMDQARKVLSEHANISLTREGQAKLVSLLLQPTEPTDAMRELMNMPDLPEPHDDSAFRSSIRRSPTPGRRSSIVGMKRLTSLPAIL